MIIRPIPATGSSLWHIANPKYLPSQSLGRSQSRKWCVIVCSTSSLRPASRNISSRCRQTSSRSSSVSARMSIKYPCCSALRYVVDQGSPDVNSTLIVIHPGGLVEGPKVAGIRQSERGFKPTLNKFACSANYHLERAVPAVTRLPVAFRCAHKLECSLHSNRRRLPRPASRRNCKKHSLPTRPRLR